jgi:hypothetical protein
MTTPDELAHLAARIEAHDALRLLAGSNRRDRLAFTLGYILAFDAMAPHLPPDQIPAHRARAQALHALCDKDLR